MSKGPVDYQTWGAEDAEEEENKPKFKRDKTGTMRQVGLLYEFDCPECDANNPWDDGFGEGADLRCHYCHQDFVVVLMEGTKIKLKAAG